MEPFSPDLTTILVLVAVILAGVTFIMLTVVIICLLRAKYRRPRTVKPVDDVTDESDSDISIGTAVNVKPAKKPSSKGRFKKAAKPKVQRTVSPVHSVVSIDDTPFPSYSGNRDRTQQLPMKPVPPVPNNRNPMYNVQQQRQRSRSPVTTVSDGQFIERRTPYPADVLVQDKKMKNHLRFPRDRSYEYS